MIEHNSYINGAFKGWTGRGTYQLVDGSVWTQVNYLYQYQYLYRPAARIVGEGGRRYLEVDGMRERVEVRGGSADDLEAE